MMRNAAIATAHPTWSSNSTRDVTNLSMKALVDEGSGANAGCLCGECMGAATLSSLSDLDRAGPALARDYVVRQ